MKVVLVMAGRTIILRPGPVTAKAPCDCPECGEALRVRGAGGRISPCDRYYLAQGYCVECDAAVGEIRAYPSTIFGIEEDERVLHGRPRVY